MKRFCQKPIKCLYSYISVRFSRDSFRVIQAQCPVHVLASLRVPAPISITMRLRVGETEISMLEGCSAGGRTFPCVTQLVQLSPPPFVYKGCFLIRSEMCREYYVFNVEGNIFV